MTPRIAGSFVVGLFAWFAAADAGADEPPRIIRLDITPAVEPLPSLKYQLLPEYHERRPGNAAVRYARAALAHRTTDEVDGQANDWLNLPFAEFRKPEVLEKIAAAGTDKNYDEIRLAARLQSCEWELPIREQIPFAVLLPEVQELRRLARFVALKARREAAEGRFDQAVATLQTGYALARHAAQGPTLINGLVGLAITHHMDRVLLDLAQSPGAPSLYWALTFQPRPLIDLRPGFEAEMSSLYLMLPQLLEADAKSPVDASAALDRLFRELAALGRLGTDEPPLAGLKMFGTKVAVLAMAALRKQELCDFLIACGRPAERVKKMNEAELVLAYTRLKYEELRDRQFRWMALPTWQARAGLDDAGKRLKQSADAHEELLPFGGLLLPAVGSVNHAHGRGERRLDALRIIEALRLYAGKHDGNLPLTLDEVTDVPLPPLDLITGKPFTYRRDGERALLILPDEYHGSDGERTLTYEISVQMAK